MAAKSPTRFFARYGCDNCRLRNRTATRDQYERTIELDGSKDAHPVSDWYFQFEDGRKLLWITCPVCGGQMHQQGRRGYAGTVTNRGCNEACWQATGGDCRCSCGGMAHGISA